MKILITIFLTFSFFPYLKTIPTATDIQPNTILFGSILFIFFFLENRKISISEVILFIPFVFSIVLIPFSGSLFTSMRSISGLYTLSILTIVYVIVLKNYNERFLNVFKFSSFVWFFIGLIQLFVSREFMLEFVSRMTASLDRGVTSLAPEATFYGLVFLFYFLIVDNLDIKNKKKYKVFFIIQIVFLAQSSMIILFLIIYIVYSFLLQFKLTTKIWVGLCSISILFILISIGDVDSRFFKLLNLVMEHPLEIFLLDASANDRASAIYFSVKGFYDNFFLPNGFANYSNYLVSELGNNEYFWWVSVNDRIMSFYGGLLFELGLVGLIYPLIISYLIYRTHRNDLKKFLVNFCFVNTILWTAIPMSFPLLAMYLASLIYKTSKIKDCIIEKEENLILR